MNNNIIYTNKRIMIKKCMFPECSIAALFNIPSETKGIYCFTHKTKDMVNVNSKKCILEKRIFY